jgi:uncharacterized protein
VNLKQRAHAFQVKAVDEKTGEFSGYGSVFDVVDSYGDAVIKGAFAKSLEGWKGKSKLPAMLWQHRMSEPIGVWTKMEEDDRGLYVEGRILLSAGDLERRAYEHLKAGSLSGLSIGYQVPKGGAIFDADSETLFLKEIDLFEVSLVTFPANEAAQVDAVKAALDGGPKEFERFLREAGLSRNEAKGLMARGFEGLRDLREAEGDELEAVNSLKSLLAVIRA